MTATKKRVETFLMKEAIGFTLILLINWFAEIARLPHLLYGEPAGFNWFRVLLRTAVILAIWLWVHLATRRLLQRLHHLEEFLRICSWCRKVDHDGEWLTLEQYFGSKFNTETSHAICPECARTQLTAHRTATRVAHPAA